MRTELFAGALIGLAIGVASCVNVHVDPIYAKVDVNIKVDQELDSFFDDVQKKQAAPAPAVPVPPAAPAAAGPTTGPSTGPADSSNAK